MRNAEVTVEPTLRKDTMSAVEIVVAGLKSQILARKLRAGDRLPNEIELCSLFGVGRSTLREGIKTLAAQGLLEMRHGVGTFLTDGKNQAFYDTLFYHLLLAAPSEEEIARLRRMIEIDVIRLIDVHYEENQKERYALARNVSEMAQKIEANCDTQTLIKVDVRFHQILAEASKDFVIGSVYRSLIDYVHLSIAESYTGQRPARVLESHRRILELIEKRETAKTHEVIDFALQPWHARRKD